MARFATFIGLQALAVSGVAALGPSPSVQAVQQPAFRASVETVAVYATVQDRDGHLVPGLTREDFELRDNGRPVDITTFSNDLVPITVALLLDMSGSMGREFLNVRRATSQFFSTLLPGDRVRLGTFGTEVALSPVLTGDREVLERILEEEVWPSGGTPLWAAMRAAMRSLDDEPGRRVVLVLTDGQDACSFGRQRCSSAGEVEEIAEEGSFIVYGVGMEGRNLADRLADMSERSGGGHRVLAANAELAQAFADVAAELHHQYMIGFAPQVRDGRTHRLDVQVKGKGLTARARQSYRAPRGGRP
jgi:Ca-activated chloride channel family protein